jgi:hypothetical protein
VASYHHTQFGKLWILLLLLAVSQALIGLQMVVAGREEGAGVVLLITGTALFLAAQCFVALTVSDRGDHLVVQFGPVPLFRKRIPYAEMLSVEPSRSTLLEGWGIHLVPGRGWTWNVWGRDCVDVNLVEGNRARIGTDDQAQLLAFLRARLGQAA